MPGGNRSLRSETGQVTAFVAIFVVALIFVVGLVVDGGNILTARRQATNEASQAARAGAQAIDLEALRRDGTERLDEAAARAAAQAYLAHVGSTGEVGIVDDTVVVTVTIDRPLAILGVGGLGSVQVSGTGTSEGVQGVTDALPE